MIGTAMAACLNAANIWDHLAWARDRDPKTGWGSREAGAFNPVAWYGNEQRGRLEQFNVLSNPPARLIAYVGKATLDAMGRPAVSRRALTTWMGAVIGTCRLTSSWRVNSYIGSRMYQIHATIAGRAYTGRGFGEGCSVNLRECK